jgi:hypothetical protein
MCSHCFLPHKDSVCNLHRYKSSPLCSLEPCKVFLSRLHASANCPLLSDVRFRPTLSCFTVGATPTPSEADSLRASQLFNCDLDTLHFPNNCSRKQFLDYWDTMILGLELASAESHVHSSVKAVKLFGVKIITLITALFAALSRDPIPAIQV